MATRNTRLWTAMYHSIDDRTNETDDPYRVTVSPARLDRQLRWLRDRGLRGVSVRELLRAARRGDARGLVGLTFDDGYADFLDNAVPLLRRHDCTATVFVLPGRFGGDNAWDEDGPRKPLLTEDGVRRCAAAGMEVASHGLLHVSLPPATDLALSEETRLSRELLRTVTGTAPEGFCYPYGHLDARTVRAVREAGYAYGAAVGPPPELAGVFALPRVHIGQRDTGWRLHAKRRLHALRRAAVDLAPAPMPVS
ncbi:polysaccharide deacetylase family protein [Streptomyces ficellus]|uniref:Polysaccharide deacetylase family protein n=1 Tax=Streptomyces ficellus TaxID=1977088 RepID=A0ABT7Z9H0_9ACTN|nr:polysaccharide deacetylase family protein [Streptomyces ficellus]MDN3296139.1 polysaccharide deacetylase family protein [Streptomyces ficellus]